nr:hypothetical protein [Tanacetum cinerariifolium]
RACGGRSERLADIASLDSRRDSRGVPYRFWTVRSLMSWVVRMHSRLDWLCTSLRVMHLLGGRPITAGTAKEQAKNFQWGLRKSTLNHLMCILFTDVAQVANTACNYEILHERDDDGAERPDKRQKSGDQHQPTTQ